ncbi:MAG: hypothetical protein J5771_07490 [Bacteroidales bacterium]|nr:hypothetical protein [Bacteroidales bacterium]
MTLLERYVQAIEEFKESGFDYLKTWKENNREKAARVGEIIDHYSIADTLWVCDNSKIEPGCVLIMGINPSFPGKKSGVCSFANTANINHSAYWQTKKDMVNNPEEVAYLDLFPIAMTRQADFMNDIVIPRKLKSELLKITRQEIERLHPSIIINPNYGSAVYWGLKPKHPWMGYDMELLPNNRIGKQTKLYRIRGTIRQEDVIDKTPTVLGNTRFLLAKYHGNGALKKEEYLTYNDLDTLIHKQW